MKVPLVIGTSELSQNLLIVRHSGSEIAVGFGVSPYASFSRDTCFDKASCV